MTDVSGKKRSWPIWLAGMTFSLALLEATALLVERTDHPDPVFWYDASTQHRVEMLDTVEPELVFAGTSMAWQAFVPSTFDEHTGLRSFNVGLAGAVPTVTGPWLKVVHTHVEPDILVWGLSSLDVSTSYGAAPRRAWQDAPATRSDVLGRMDTNLRDRSAFFRVRRLLRRPDQLWGDGATDRSADWSNALETTGDSGERLDFTSDKSARTSRIMASRLSEFDIDPVDLSALERTILYLQGKGVRVILVELPVPPSFVELHPRQGADHQMTGAALELLADHLAIEFVDLNDGFSESDFVDFTHLTAEAADRFTASFATWFTTQAAAS